MIRGRAIAMNTSRCTILLMTVTACQATIRDKDDLATRVGQIVTVDGTLADTPWQHPVAPPPSHRRINYMDLSDTFQLVVYSRDRVTCTPGQGLRVRGRVVRIEVPAKRARESDPRTTVTAFHVAADTWECQ